MNQINNPWISTTIICIFGYFYNNYRFSSEQLYQGICQGIDWLIRKNKVILEGNRTQVMGFMSDYLVESYSNRFNAVWFYIIEHIQEN